MADQRHPKKIVVPGNHDMIMDANYYESYWSDWSEVKESHDEAMWAFVSKNIEVLIDQTTTVQGFRFFGSPWVTQGHDWVTAFNQKSADMEACWACLPDSDVTRQSWDSLVALLPPVRNSLSLRYF